MKERGRIPGRILTVDEFNALDRDAFTDAIGHVFEHSAWIANETWARRPFRDVAHLHEELCATLRNAPRERQLALIRAHPDLAGRLAQQRKLTTESAHEQASAGLDRLSESELVKFQVLNDAHRSRFGFPFIVCARLNAQDAILAAMEARSGNTPGKEFRCALGEIEKIAALRLGDRLNSSDR
ncbi:MAG: 2-oxo-4-hydroxy-4-carboxy-5-ureidoimidazoline decarboxylase [Opitutaceae bacterium]